MYKVKKVADRAAKEFQGKGDVYKVKSGIVEERSWVRGKGDVYKVKMINNGDIQLLCR